MNRKVIPLMAAVTILTLTGCATIEPGQRAVKVNMGKMDEHLMTEGFHAYNPFMENLYPYTVKQEKKDGTAKPLTKDQQDITIHYSVWYRVPENKITTLFSQYTGDPYQTLVFPQVQEAFRDVAAKYKAEEITGDLGSVKAQVLESVRKGLKDLVVVEDIPITDINLPATLAAAIEAKQVMEQAALKKQYELDKEKRQAEITVTKAKAEAESIRVQGQALQASPELVKLKWVEKWNGQMPVTMAGSGGNLYIPTK